MWNVDTAVPDPVCSTPNTNAYHCDFIWTSCPSPQRCAERKLQRSVRIQPRLFQCTSFAGSFADAYGEKLQHVVLALHGILQVFNFDWLDFSL